MVKFLIRFVIKMNDIEYHNLLSCQDNLNLMIKNYEKLGELEIAFRKFTSNLGHTDYTAFVEKCTMPCHYCHSPPTKSSRLLGCGHFICSTECFQILVGNTIGTITKYDQLKCPECSKIIPKSIIKEFYGGEEEFRTLLNNFAPKIMCNICYLEKSMTEFKTYDCNHRHCIQCVTESVYGLITTGIVGDAICCPECSLPLKYELIISVLQPEIKDKYDNFLIRNVTFGPNEYLVQCIGKSGVNCDYGQVVSKDRDIYECPQCGVIFCPKCKREVHPKMTCEAKIKLMNIEDLTIRKEVEEGKMLICP